MFDKMIRARNKKGFTLMEMLIVVAIIAILVAISIPVFSSQLTKAKQATDDANLRAAKAVATVTYLDGDTEAGTYYYDIADGTLVADAPAAYSKAADGEVIKVVIAADGATTEWVAKP